MESKILVVDDDVDFQEATKNLLEAKGYIVVTASNGEEGYQKAKAEKPDLMLLDVMMANDSDGFDTARKLKEDPATKDIAIIMITGIRKAKGLPFSFEPDPDWLPVRAVLEKPVKPDELLKMVQKAIEGLFFQGGVAIRACFTVKCLESPHSS
jgi:two-component system, OmpR family, alkaline phosphatase synthesis response regulator PhoP